MKSPLIFGVLNVTPDSFSDGGKFASIDNAVSHAHAMSAAGADVIDVGGESTRPGAASVDRETEQSRVLPVIRELKAAGLTVSLDTMHADTARKGIELGVDYINDVSGGKADAEMFTTVAHSNAQYILMHWRGDSKIMDSLAHYKDVTSEVCSELLQQVDKAVESGIQPDRIVLDPGFGFAKNEQQNWELLRNLDALVKLPHRLLIGVSRKRFLASTTWSTGNIEARDAATSAISFLAARQNVWGVRVHDVASTFAVREVAHSLEVGEHE